LKLSIVMPAFNEEATLQQVMKRTLDAHYPCEVELIVVDDGSSDGTADVIARVSDPRVLSVRHPSNRGKGAAVSTGVDHATGDYLVICDADLEYEPEEIPSLLEPVIAGEADVVYGTRTFGSHTAYSFWYVLGDKLVTLWANVLFNTWLSDIEVCFKLLPVDLYRSLRLRSTGFGIEAEVTAKLLKAGHRPYEVPVRYVARTRDEGKKLTWRDGVEAVWLLLRWRVGRSSYVLAPRPRAR
jgi:glycosyltransferase involved in cell wall biosynthesis